MNSMDALIARRAIRKFQDRTVEPDILMQLLHVARLYPSGGNLQPIRFAIVTQEMQLERVFRCLNWAMYLPDFQISQAEHPKAYILLLSDNRGKQNCMFEAGAAATYIMVAAKGLGLDSCCLGIARPQNLAETLSLEDGYTPIVAIALGYAAQSSTVIPMVESVKYTQTVSGDILVPKRDEKEVLIYSDIPCGDET